MDETTRSALRAPFPPELIGKRPQPTCRDCTRAPAKVCDNRTHVKTKCDVCGQYMTSAHTHLDYVGHADITDRFLQVDPDWSWEPVERQVDPQVLAAAVATGNPEVIRAVMDSAPPKFDHTGGLWIKLTIAGVTRLGYGDAQGKTGPNAIKEVIGDALRNAGMRFGVGLDMWRKEVPEPDESNGNGQRPQTPPKTDHQWLAGMERRIAAAESDQELVTLANEVEATVQASRCEQVHRDHLYTLGRQREAALAGEHPQVPPSTTATSPPATSADPPTDGSVAQQHEARINTATTVEQLDQIKAEVMADFKAQKFDPAAGNALIRLLKERTAKIEVMAA